MKDKHIPDLLKTGLIESHEILRAINNEGSGYSFRYRFKALADYEEYREKHAPALQKDVADKYGGKFKAARNLYEELRS